MFYKTALYSVLCICLLVTDVVISASDHIPRAVVSSIVHEPFDSSSSDMTHEQQNTMQRLPTNLTDISSVTNSTSDSSPEEKEEDLLSETAINIGLPKYLSSKMVSLKPYIKLAIRNKNKNKEDNEDVVLFLKRASSGHELFQTPPNPRMRTRPSSLNSNDDVPGSVLSHISDYDHNEKDHPSYELQRERIKIQHLLLEASQAALESKELELQQRAQLLKEKEKKLEERFSKKETAGITTAVSCFTTLAGTLTAYYSSQK